MSDQSVAATAPSAGIPITAFKRQAKDERPKAGGILFMTPEGDALFLKRSSEMKHPGEWNLPGGHADDGEDFEEAARRETEEETGVAPGEITPVDAHTNEEDDVDYVTYICPTRRFIPKIDFESSDYVWASLEDPPKPLHKGLERFLNSQQALGNIGEDEFLPRREGRQHMPRMGEPHMERLPRPGPHTSTNVKNYDEAPSVTIDREHDGPWLSAMSRDGSRMYVNKALPHYVDVGGKTVNVDDWLQSHELPEWHDMQEQLAALPGANEEARIKVYETAHERSGTAKEREWAAAQGLDWKALQAWARGEESKLEKGPFENEPEDADVKPARCHPGELAATDAMGIALDRESVRIEDVDGRMSVAVSNISKANVCPYRGREIPNYEDLGLDADEVYFLYRDPDELAKAAPTFHRVQVLRRHVPVSADDHKPYDVIGATGSDATFEYPYLRSSLSIWEQDAIEDIKAGRKKELSCGYHYVADMVPGVSPDGERYDGVMRNIVGNHVAVVEDGRAGPDVVVGDSTEALFGDNMADAESLRGVGGDKMTTPQPSKPLPTKFANLALQLTARGLRPVLAQDAKIDLLPIFADVTSKNFPEKKKGIIKAIEKETKGKLAKDANLGHITELLDHLEHPSSDESVSGAQHRAMEAAAHGNSTLGIPQSVGQEFHEADKGKTFSDNAANLGNFLRGKGMDEESIKAACDMAYGHAGPFAKDKAKDNGLAEALAKHELEEHAGEEGKDQVPPQFRKEGEEGEKKDDDEKEGKDAMPAHTRTGSIGATDQAIRMTKQAFDKAMETAVKQARTEARENEREIRMALDEVRPYVGNLPADAYETPKQVYRKTLLMLGVDEKTVEELNKPAMKAMLRYMPKAGARPPAGAEDRALAMDAGGDRFKKLDEKFGIGRIQAA